MAEAFILRGERATLREYLGEFTAEVTQAARAVKIEGGAGGGGLDGRHRIHGVAREDGQASFSVSLVRANDAWSGRCTCTAAYRCKHLYALGAHWLVQVSGAPAGSVTSTQNAAPAAPVPAPIPESTAFLASLTSYLQTFDEGTRRKGLGISRTRAVKILGVNKGLLGARVAGSTDAPYVTTLGHGSSGWYGECSCPVGHRCKHLYALGITAIESAVDSLREIVVASLRSTVPAAPTPDRPVPVSPAKPAKPLTFRDTWRPRLAEKIGRPLTRDEAVLLDRLSAAFHQLKTRGYISASWLHQNDLWANPNRPPASRFAYEPAFTDYWTHETAPTDPWELWQYIAYDWGVAGRSLPEAFLPKTDTSAVSAVLDRILINRELEVWRNAVAVVKIPVFAQAAPSANELAKTLDLRVQITPRAGRELQGLMQAPKSARMSWRSVTQKWLKVLDQAPASDWAHLPAPARELALALRLRPPAHYGGLQPLEVLLSDSMFGHILKQSALHASIVLPDESPFRIEPAPLQVVAQTIPNDPARLALSFALPDGALLPLIPPCLFDGPPRLYLWDNRVWPGPPPPVAARLPIVALSDPSLSQGLFESGLRLPASLEVRFQTVSLPPFLRLWTQEDSFQSGTTLRATLQARSATPPCAQVWTGFRGWQWLPPGPPHPAGPDAAHFHFDLAAAKAVGARFGDFRFVWWEGEECWVRPVGKNFPEEFLAWRATLPTNVEIEVSPELRGLLGAPLRAKLSVDLSAVEGSGRDWFDLSLQLTPEDTTLTPEELRLLLKARGAWVRLPARGWQRLETGESLSAESQAALARLGLSADDETLSGRRTTHRFHALQLADAPVDDAALAARLRARAAELRALSPPALPAGLQADLRPYQLEGYHFLAHLSGQGLGGVLADDMGLGKTLQTLAWLLWLAESKAASASAPDASPFRALVVAPKSVVPNWAVEAARFVPALTTARLPPGLPPPPEARVLVINYTQLRLRAAELAAVAWDAVVLDEGQNIKNPGSATARAARDLPARHRLVLTGTPIENRLLDLWSLLAFAQPGLLGTQAGFQRLYDDKEDPVGARARLATRARPFMLRRTKGQVARDLPARIEEEIGCELEGVQRALYDAELKRARQMLLEVKTAREFDGQRFNILQSLLRLRQICCDPRLLGLDAAPGGDASSSAAAAPASEKKRGRPAKAASVPAGPAAPGETTGAASDDDGSARRASAKLDALLDTIEPLVAEGHRVLVFSQFVTMLELIREELIARGIRHLLLTGQTENRQDLVNEFQSAGGPPVFLLSLKAAGSGLNLTAASYVVLFDPWWNPAVEAQAIDRTHRIGQVNTVIAYRLIARGTIEEKIRALQREKSDLASAVVQEESLAKVMDLESLRRILG